LGCLLEKIHVAWAHLEKKRTRLRLYTKSLKKLYIQSVETASRVSSDGVRTFEVTASKRGRPKETLEDLCHEIEKIILLASEVPDIVLVITPSYELEF
ncbi:hypothetical protein Tco_0689501, partial [Tanacetum coccineum]